MAEHFSRFDAADYLRDEADADAYLHAAADDPAALVAAIGAVARARTMADLARRAGMSREGVYKALSPAGNPSFATIAKIAAALGYRVSLNRSNSADASDPSAQSGSEGSGLIHPPRQNARPSERGATRPPRTA